MSLPARFEATVPAGDCRASERRELRLTISAAVPESPELAVTIHDLSESGLLLETSLPLKAGQAFDIFLPLAGAVETTVVWSSHNFHGCQFSERVPRAAVSAALLQSTPAGEQPGTRQPATDVLSQLRDVNAKLEQLGHDPDLEVKAVGEPERFYEPLPAFESDPASPVVIISLILAGLAVLILIVALLGPLRAS